MQADTALSGPVFRNTYNPAPRILWRKATSLLKRTPNPKPAREFLWETTSDAHGKKCLHVHALFMSDMHLGTHHSRPKWICRFLENVVADHFFAPGDLIDREHMRHKRAWKFPPAHRQVLGHLFRKAAHLFGGNHEAPHGAQPSNDNESLSRGEWLARKLYHRPVYDEMRYTDPKGRVIKIEHSDQFDDVVLGRWKGFWYWIGDLVHNPIADLDTFVQDRLGWEWFSLSAFLKVIAKRLINELGVKKAIMKSVDADPTIDAYLGGHTHDGGIWKTPGGKTIMNSGHCTVHAVQSIIIDRNGTRAFVSNWREDYCEVREENGSSYKKYYHELGLEKFAKPSLIEDQVMREVDAVIARLTLLAAPRPRHALVKQALKFMGRRAATPISSADGTMPEPHLPHITRVPTSAVLEKAAL